MSGSDYYSGLHWRLRTPAHFRSELKALQVDQDGIGAALHRLAGFGHDYDDLAALARRLEAARKTGVSLHPLKPLTLGLLSDGTLDLLAPALTGTGLRYKFDLKLQACGYGQALQDALAPDSPLVAAHPDFTLIALDWRSLPLKTRPGDEAAHAESVSACLALIDAMREGVARNVGGQVILASIAPPPERLFGGLDRVLKGSVRSVLSDVNQGLAERAATSGDLFLDLEGLADTVGLAAWHDPSQWMMAKLAFAEAFIPLFADHVARLLAAARGLSRRVLVLDLDNTLWGGVIGDDGLSGIRLAQGDATGEAHLAVQQLALDLRARGVLIAVCSKNDDAVARQVFQEHPEMLLRERDIAAFQANWADKATNIQAMAETLSLGLESFVFLDDNPMERDLVRQALPEVAVLEVGSDPSEYARAIAASGLFELPRLLDEDLKRADFYSLNAERSALKAAALDLDGYLASLEMEIVFSPFDAVGRSRITQLVNKSNQFNLTTRRYTEPEIKAVEEDPHAVGLQVRLIDKFGDNGMISVLIAREDGEGDLVIDTWLMSCRVLGRGVETMVLRELVALARARGLKRLVGVYRPTERNAMVKDHYSKLGFEPLEERKAAQPGAETWWALSAACDPPSRPMVVRRQGADPAPAL